MNDMRKLINLMEGVESVPGVGIATEGAHTQHYLDANKPSKVRQDAEIAKAEKERADAKKAKEEKKPVEEGAMFHPDADKFNGDGSDSEYNQRQEMYQHSIDDLHDRIREYLAATYSPDSTYSEAEAEEVARALGCNSDVVWEYMEDNNLFNATGDGYNDSYDMSDDADALASADLESDEVYYPDTDGMDSPTDFDEYEMNADDSVDEGTGIDDLFNDEEPEDEEVAGEDEEDRICGACNGSGEGMFDGTRCSSCRGTGEEPRESDFDDFDPPDDYRESQDGPLEETDLNNGYDTVKTASGEDFFPNGADSPVTDLVGPSGARQGDNPEQKKLQVAETHKELVYNYRKFLEESSKK
jgi:hypothetical protein